MPDLTGEDDCSRFDKFEEEEPFYPQEEKRGRKVRKDINFVGYTYKKDVEEQKIKLVQALNETYKDQMPTSSNASTDIATDEGPRQRKTNETNQMNTNNF